MKNKLILAAMCVLTMLFQVPAYSQEGAASEGAEVLPEEMPEEASPLDEIMYSYGVLVEVNKDSNEITVKQYDWDTDVEVNVAYVIDSDTKVDGAPSWAEIPQGNYVELEYIEGQDGKKNVKYINVFPAETSE